MQTEIHFASVPKVRDAGIWQTLIDQLLYKNNIVGAVLCALLDLHNKPIVSCCYLHMTYEETEGFITCLRL